MNIKDENLSSIISKIILTAILNISSLPMLIVTSSFIHVTMVRFYLHAKGLSL